MFQFNLVYKPTISCMSVMFRNWDCTMANTQKIEEFMKTIQEDIVAVAIKGKPWRFNVTVCVSIYDLMCMIQILK